jgi:hypothetical protein
VATEQPNKDMAEVQDIHNEISVARNKQHMGKNREKSRSKSK